MQERNKESGNILIYILGAIFLLGILVVMIKGSSTPGSNIDKETLILRVSEVQQYGQELERAVAYIMSNGYSEADIRFAHPNAHSSYGLITDDPSRQVFSRDGGGAAYREPPAGIQNSPTDWVFTSANAIGTIGSGDCSTDSCTDLVALLQNLTREFCIQLNKTIGMDNPLDSPPIDNTTYASNTLFTGAFTYSNKIQDAGSLYILNQNEGCFEGVGIPAIGEYTYYRVLLAR